jgi:lactoylglutathione lyase
MARVLEFRVALTVEDYDEALRFYRDGLGLPVEEAWDRPDGRGAILGVRPLLQRYLVGPRPS